MGVSVSPNQGTFSHSCPWSPKLSAAYAHSGIDILKVHLLEGFQDFNLLPLSCGTVAAPLTWWQCGKCGQEFKTKAELQCHQFSMHGWPRPWRRPRGGAATISTNQLPSSYLLLVYFILTKYIVLNYLFIQLSKKLKNWSFEVAGMRACRVLSSAGQGSKTFCETRAKVKYRDQSFIPNIHFCYAQHCQVQDPVACKVVNQFPIDRREISNIRISLKLYCQVAPYTLYLHNKHRCSKSRYLQPWCSIRSSHRWK